MRQCFIILLICAVLCACKPAPKTTTAMPTSSPAGIMTIQDETSSQMPPMTASIPTNEAVAGMPTISDDPFAALTTLTPVITPPPIPPGSKAKLACPACGDFGDSILLWETIEELVSLGSFPSGTQVIVLDEATRADGKPFYKVQVGNVIGWVVKDMVVLE